MNERLLKVVMADQNLSYAEAEKWVETLVAEEIARRRHPAPCTGRVK